MKIFSFEARSNGYYGQPFAIGALVTNDDGEVARYIARCPIEGKINRWVRMNVLPNIKDVSINEKNYQTLLSSFYKFYRTNEVYADVIAHVGHPVETKILRDMIEQDEELRRWRGPYPLLDVASFLHSKGENPLSVSDYNKKYNLSVPFEAKVHHPLYDAFCAEVAYRHLMQK